MRRLVLRACLAAVLVTWFAGPTRAAEVTPADRAAYLAALAATASPAQAETAGRLLAVVPGFDPVNDELLLGSPLA